MTNLHALLSARRTVHDFRDEPLEAGVLDRALQAAVSAPNHRMTEPWQFVQVGPLTRQKLLERSFELKSKPNAPLTDSARRRLEAKILNPAELLIVSQKLHAKPKIAEEDYAAIACAIQNMMLSLSADKVGSKWSTGALTTDPTTYALAGLSEQTDRIVGFVWIGLAVEPHPGKPPRRRPFADLLRRLP